MKKGFFKKESKIAIVVIIAIFLLVWGIKFLKGTSLFSREQTFYAVYTDVEGLIPSNSVLLNGYKLGTVQSINLMNDKGDVLVEFTVERSVKLPKNTVAEVASSDLLGGKAIRIHLGDSKEYAQDGDTLQSAIEAGMLQQLGVENMKTQLIVTLASVDTLVGNLNQMLNEQNQQHISNTLDNVEKITGNLSHATKDINALIATNKESVNIILANLEQVTDSLTKIQLTETVANANKMIDELTMVAQKLNRGEGTAGKFINDDAVYKNIEEVTANLNKLAIDLKEHPKRYVHFSVFGKKDK